MLEVSKDNHPAVALYEVCGFESVGELVEFITSGPTLALVLEGESAIEVVRTTMGATNPVDSAPGTIRGDLALAMPDNLVHGSDSTESAERELQLWFGD